MLMLCGRRHSRWRRATAWLAVWAFLLLGATAALHRHGSPSLATAPVSDGGATTLQAASGHTGHAPGTCLACIWSRAAVGAPAAGSPHVVLPGAVQPLHSAPQPNPRPLLSSSHASRAPPAPSA